ncbi:CaiB/BaiF CoA transferase family protein [Acidocella sp.]|uniref:CaiB/BaiF CoA transferase family protein n=1 Tax=Acidocella sp. TaxID=50710 RepID=UPI0039B75997
MFSISAACWPVLGPASTLADLGAEVIKVEKPGVGDDTRRWGPPFLSADKPGAEQGESAYFLSANRGKKSITIDFTKPEGQALVKRLAAGSDIMLENFKLGGLARLGLDYESLRTLNPRLIYCSITGFGQTGPYRHRAGYDFLMQGMSGLMSVTGEPAGEPMKVGVAVTDLFTGMYATTAVLAALAERERSGLGQHIDIALFDVQVATMANQIMSYLVSGEQPPRLGNAHPSIVPYQVFPTADGHVIIAVGNDDQFARLVMTLGVPEFAADPRFATNPARVANRAVLIADLATLIGEQTSRHWIAALEAVGVPCGPINGFADLDTDEQVLERRIFTQIAHPHGEIRGVASPIRFSRTEVDDTRPPPLLGEDTNEILAEVLGLREAEIASLRQAKIV